MRYSEAGEEKASAAVFFFFSSSTQTPLHPSFSSIFLPFQPPIISTPKDGDCTSWDYQCVIQFLMIYFQGFCRHTALVIKRWLHSGNSGRTGILKWVRMGGSVWHRPPPLVFYIKGAQIQSLGNSSQEESRTTKGKIMAFYWEKKNHKSRLDLLILHSGRKADHQLRYFKRPLAGSPAPPRGSLPREHHNTSPHFLLHF